LYILAAIARSDGAGLAVNARWTDTGAQEADAANTLSISSARTSNRLM
jgi:hypothetical protein